MKMLASEGIWEFYDYILCFAKLVIIFGTLKRDTLDPKGKCWYIDFGNF